MLLALQLQHEILFKPVTINILHNIYLLTHNSGFFFLQMQVYIS